MSMNSGSGDNEPTRASGAAVIDLLHRHTTMPGRSVILSEAFELARRLQREEGVGTAEPSAETHHASSER